MAVKPWIGALVAPSNRKSLLSLEPQFVPEAPNKKLNFKFIFVNGFKI